MSSNSFRIGHISDLHFSGGTSIRHEHHAHSTTHLCQLEQSLLSKNVDILTVTGDITNTGDDQEFLTASQFLYERIKIANDQYTGLGFDKDKVVLVPGNHDAFNCSPKTLPLLDRWQKSIANYDYNFPEHAMRENFGCYYRYFGGEMPVFIACVDSCFLGDTDPDSDCTFGTIRYDQHVAKGNMSVLQTERLLEWHDQGVRGYLPRLDSSGTAVPDTYIDKDEFASSLKILVMHHYLFEPSGHSSDYFMNFKHRDTVFRNIAFANFDMLLCGHKHIHAFDKHSYKYHFDNRAIGRHMMNCFRRRIGMHSEALQIVDENGKKWSKPLSALCAMLIKYVIRKDTNSSMSVDDISYDVISSLKKGLEDPTELVLEGKRIVSLFEECGVDNITKGEMKSIHKHLSVSLSVEERKKLRNAAQDVLRDHEKLGDRKFLQIMSGSTTKSCDLKAKDRSYNIIDISKVDGDWSVTCEKYDWDWNKFEFSENNIVSNFKIPHL